MYIVFLLTPSLVFVNMYFLSFCINTFFAIDVVPFTGLSV